MRTLCATFLLATLVGAAGTGCDAKKEGQPNPDLKVPDVPPGGHSVGGRGALGEKDSKKPSKDNKETKDAKSGK